MVRIHQSLRNINLVNLRVRKPYRVVGKGLTFAKFKTSPSNFLSGSFVCSCQVLSFFSQGAYVFVEIATITAFKEGKAETRLIGSQFSNKATFEFHAKKLLTVK